MKSNDFFDICVIGEGIAGSVFLWNLFTNVEKTSLVSKSQNLSVAVVSNEKMAPSCTLRSSATVSLNGISEDVSPLGNDMREAYFLFENFFKLHQPDGVTPVNRVVVATNDKEGGKLTRRYKQISSIENSLLHETHQGVEYLSYLLSPTELLNWFHSHTHELKKDNSLTHFQFFVKNIQKIDGGFLVSDQQGHDIRARKIVFASGAYAKIYHHFFQDIIGPEKEMKNEIKAGFYLERYIDLGPQSFYLSIDGTNILYRYNEEKPLASFLQIGSVSVLGAYPIPPEKEISILFEHIKAKVTFDLGKREDYKVVCGLRHKAPKRMIEAFESKVTENIYHLNGFYKNGFSMSFLAAQKLVQLLSIKGET